MHCIQDEVVCDPDIPIMIHDFGSEGGGGGGSGTKKNRHGVYPMSGCMNIMTSIGDLAGVEGEGEGDSSRQ